MKNLRKLLYVFLMLIVIGVLVGYIYAKKKAKQGLPDYSANISLSNLGNPVEVYRDKNGIPHIFAKSQSDLYRVVGYLMAEERMWQMDLMRRATLGRLSEIFGDEFVQTDLLLRSLRYSEKSTKILNESPPEVIEMLEAFSDGVNQYITKYKGNYPLEFLLLGYEPDRWEPYQSVNLIGFMAWDLKAGWNELILTDLQHKLDSAHFAEIIPQLERFKTVIYNQKDAALLSGNNLQELDRLDKLGMDVFSGSNNWAVSGKKSVTGFPIVANDMHLSFSVPGVWIQMHQVVEGELDVSGLVLPGQPMIIVGHNDSIAWGMTNTYVDNLDYYEEKINPDDSNQYMLNGEWKNFKVVQEQIKSKSGKTFTEFYKVNHRGPVVSGIKEIKDKVLTIRWIGDEPSNEILSIYKVNRAQNWQDFKESFRTFRAVSQNIVYGDRKGNIGMYACAGVPIRKRDAVFKVLPGWTDEFDWQGLVPFDELPYEYNPERGYVSSANNRTIGDEYPYHIGTWYAMPYRIDRIRELLTLKEKLSIQDFQAMQNDSRSKLAERITTELFSLLDSAGMTETELAVYRKLKGWDGSMDKELIEPLVHEVFVFQLLNTVFKDEMGEELFGKFVKNECLNQVSVYNLLENKNSPWIDNINTPEPESLKEIVNLTFSDAISWMTENYGTKQKNWKWGSIHQIELEHPLSKVKILDLVFNLNRGPFPVSGARHTICPYTYPMFDPGKVNHGASHRSLFSLENWDSTLTIIPTGTSGIISSEFYLNQTRDYINGKYLPDYFSKEAVLNSARYKIVVTPVVP